MIRPETSAGSKTDRMRNISTPYFAGEILCGGTIRRGVQWLMEDKPSLSLRSEDAQTREAKHEGW